MSIMVPPDNLNRNNEDSEISSLASDLGEFDITQDKLGSFEISSSSHEDTTDEILREPSYEIDPTGYECTTSNEHLNQDTLTTNQVRSVRIEDDLNVYISDEDSSDEPIGETSLDAETAENESRATFDDQELDSSETNTSEPNRKEDTFELGKDIDFTDKLTRDSSPDVHKSNGDSAETSREPGDFEIDKTTIDDDHEQDSSAITPPKSIQTEDSSKVKTGADQPISEAGLEPGTAKIEHAIIEDNHKQHPNQKTPPRSVRIEDTMNIDNKEDASRRTPFKKPRKVIDTPIRRSARIAAKTKKPCYKEDALPFRI